jgi:hypothetical protein
MRKIEIVEEIKTEEVLKITEESLLELIEKEGLINVLQSYDVPESFILKWGPSSPEFNGLSKSIIISISKFVLI